MPQKTIKMKEALKFAVENGYMFAVYSKRSDGYYLIEDSFIAESYEDEDFDIIVKTTGAATDFNEFTTKDKQYLFKLHNNFNVPEIIPTLKSFQLFQINKNCFL